MSDRSAAGRSVFEPLPVNREGSDAQIMRETKEDRDEIKRLRAALAPLADMAVQFDGVAEWLGNGRKLDSYIIAGGYRPLTLGHARAARAALKQT